MSAVNGVRHPCLHQVKPWCKTTPIPSILHILSKSRPVGDVVRFGLEKPHSLHTILLPVRILRGGRSVAT